VAGDKARGTHGVGEVEAPVRSRPRQAGRYSWQADCRIKPLRLMYSR